MKQNSDRFSGKENSKSKLDKTGWLFNHPVSFFLISLSFLIVIFYWFLRTAFFNEHIFEKIISINGYLSSFLLNLLGQKTTSNLGNIFSPSVSISLRLGCDGLEPMALFAAAVISFPSTVISKLKGVFLGVVFLFSVNQLRIVSLFFIQRYRPGWFELFHATIWQVVFIALALVCCGYWIQTNQKLNTVNASK